MDTKSFFDKEFNVTIRPSFFFFVVLPAAAITCLYMSGGPDLQKFLSVFAVAIGGMTAVYGSLFGYKTLKLHTDKKIAEPIKAAMSYSERWNHPSMIYTRSVVRAIRGKSIDEIMEIARTETKNGLTWADNISNALNFFEELATCIKEGSVDETAAKHLFGGIIVSLWATAGRWLAIEQANSMAQKTACCELADLVARWEKCPAQPSPPVSRNAEWNILPPLVVGGNRPTLRSGTRTKEAKMTRDMFI